MDKERETQRKTIRFLNKSLKWIGWLIAALAVIMIWPSNWWPYHKKDLQLPPETMKAEINCYDLLVTRRVVFRLSLAPGESVRLSHKYGSYADKESCLFGINSNGDILLHLWGFDGKEINPGPQIVAIWNQRPFIHYTQGRTLAFLVKSGSNPTDEELKELIAKGDSFFSKPLFTWFVKNEDFSKAYFNTSPVITADMKEILKNTTNERKDLLLVVNNPKGYKSGPKILDQNKKLNIPITITKYLAW